METFIKFVVYVTYNQVKSFSITCHISTILNLLFFTHIDIRVLHEGGCTLYETYRAFGRNAHTKACSIPRRTFEMNPICTNNNRTYDNPFAGKVFLYFSLQLTLRKSVDWPLKWIKTLSIILAICANGPIMVREKVGGVCGCPVQRSCEKVHKLQESLKSASITERTKFLVCGSDLRTYRSEHHLECSRPYNRCKQ